MDQPALKPRKTPSQARSRAMVEAILDGAARILRQGGLMACTTNRVAEVAGVSVGSLYQYFPSREAILAELIKRMRLSMSARLIAVSEAARALPLAEALPRMIEAACHQYQAEPRLTAALEEAEAGLPRDPDVLAARREVREAMIACLASRGLADPGEAAMDVIAMTRGMVMTAIAAGQTDFPALRQRIVRAALGYLQACPRVSD